MAKVSFNTTSTESAPSVEITETPVSYSPHYEYDHGPKYSAARNSDMNAVIGAIRAATSIPDEQVPMEAPAQKYVKLLKLIRGLSGKLSK